MVSAKRRHKRSGKSLSSSFLSIRIPLCLYVCLCLRIAFCSVFLCLSSHSFCSTRFMYVALKDSSTLLASWHLEFGNQKRVFFVIFFFFDHFLSSRYCIIALNLFFFLFLPRWKNDTVMVQIAAYIVRLFFSPFCSPLFSSLLHSFLISLS